MIELKDAVGNKYNMLTVIREDGFHIKASGKRLTKVLCRCDCGNEVSTTLSKVTTGHTTSCGCQKYKGNRLTHGLSKHPLMKIWSMVIDRCINSKNKSYHRYGGRGIVICDEWRNDFKVFYDWCINNGWEKGLSIERIDNNGNYEPSNCKLATVQEQARNRSTSVILNTDNETITLAEAIERNFVNKSKYYKNKQYRDSFQIINRA